MIYRLFIAFIFKSAIYLKKLETSPVDVLSKCIVVIIATRMWLFYSSTAELSRRFERGPTDAQQ